MEAIHGEAIYSFPSAIAYVLDGGRATRAGWNGSNMFIFLVKGSTFQVNRPPLLGIYPEGTTINYGSHIDIRTGDDMVRPWVPSQADMAATDWALLPRAARDAG